MNHWVCPIQTMTVLWIKKMKIKCPELQLFLAHFQWIWWKEIKIHCSNLMSFRTYFQFSYLKIYMYIFKSTDYSPSNSSLSTSSSTRADLAPSESGRFAWVLSRHHEATSAETVSKILLWIFYGGFLNPERSMPFRFCFYKNYKQEKVLFHHFTAQLTLNKLIYNIITCFKDI